MSLCIQKKNIIYIIRSASTLYQLHDSITASPQTLPQPQPMSLCTGICLIGMLQCSRPLGVVRGHLALQACRIYPPFGGSPTTKHYVFSDWLNQPRIGAKLRTGTQPGSPNQSQSSSKFNTNISLSISSFCPNTVKFASKKPPVYKKR